MLKRAVRQLVFLLVFVLLGLLLVQLAPFIWRFAYPVSYPDTLLREAERRQLDPSLVAAVINVESRWRVNALSPKGAQGLMQLMPTTGQWAAEMLGWPDAASVDLFEPENNIMLGTWYLARMLDQFDQQLPVALAAYNAGRGNVKSWLENGIWDGTLGNVNDIPFGETRRYVRKVLHNQKVYQQLYDWNK